MYEEEDKNQRNNQKYIIVLYITKSVQDLRDKVVIKQIKGRSTKQDTSVQKMKNINDKAKNADGAKRQKGFRFF